MSILYVEDNPTIRESLSSLIGLRFPSLKVLTAENGQAGLKLYKETRADLILTDIGMPVMDGIRMAREIRRLNPEASIFAPVKSQLLARCLPAALQPAYC